MRWMRWSCRLRRCSSACLLMVSPRRCMCCRPAFRSPVSGVAMVRIPSRTRYSARPAGGAVCRACRAREEYRFPARSHAAYPRHACGRAAADRRRRPAMNDLKERVRQLGLLDAVRFIGYLDRQQALPDCYAAADVFVFASRTETQGLVLLEAMAAGCRSSRFRRWVLPIFSLRGAALTRRRPTQRLSAKCWGYFSISRLPGDTWQKKRRPMPRSGPMRRWRRDLRHVIANSPGGKCPCRDVDRCGDLIAVQLSGSWQLPEKLVVKNCSHL